MTKERKYEEIEDPDFFKFENIGDSVEGKLIDIGTSEQYDFGLYTLEQEDGKAVRFHGSAQLDPRLKTVNLGDYIKVEFMDLQKQPGGKNDMKLFKVMRATS